MPPIEPKFLWRLTSHVLLPAIVLLLTYANYQQSKMLHIANDELHAATDQLNADAVALKNLRRACHLQQASWKDEH